MKLFETFTPLNKADDEIGYTQLVAAGDLKPPTNNIYLMGFISKFNPFFL